jgi:hypothetical protein
VKLGSGVQELQEAIPILIQWLKEWDGRPARLLSHQIRAGRPSHSASHPKNSFYQSIAGTGNRMSLAGNRFTGVSQRFVLPVSLGLWNVQVNMSLMRRMSRCGRWSRVRIETAYLASNVRKNIYGEHED